MKLIILLFLLLPLSLQAQDEDSLAGFLRETYYFAQSVKKPTLSDATFKGVPDLYAYTLHLIPKGTTLKLVGVANGFYHAVYKGEVGYVHFAFIDGNLTHFAAAKIPRAKPQEFKHLESEPDSIVLYGKVDVPSPLKVAPSYSAKTLYTIPKGSILKITQQDESYWKADVDGKTGYLGKSYVVSTASSPKEIIENTKTYTTQEIIQQADARLQRSQRVLRSSSQYYIRGPRGGCYYLTSSGRKQYVDRSMCN